MTLSQFRQALEKLVAKRVWLGGRDMGRWRDDGVCRLTLSVA